MTIRQVPRRQVLHLLLGVALLLLAVALAARGASPVGAATLPPIATPKTAHVQLDGALKMVAPALGGTQGFVITGQGDYDLLRRAVRFEAEVRDTAAITAGGPTRASLAAVVVDGRLYWRGPDDAGWTWIELPVDGDMGFGLLPPDGGFPAIPGLDFVLVGPAIIAGAATTHWRADFDLEAFFGAAGLATPVASDPAMPPTPQMTMSVDLWLSNADAYIHRLSWAMALGSSDGLAEAVAITAEFTVTFSNFDQPVVIIAPPGALPADVPSGTSLSGTVSKAVGFDLATLPLESFGLDVSDVGSFRTGGVKVDGLGGVAMPSPAPGRARARIVAIEPTSAAKIATATATPPRTPTAAPPTASPILVAKAVSTSVVAQPLLPEGGALQATPEAAVQARNSPLPLLATVGLGGLLLAAVGMVVLGRRMSA